MSFHINSLAEFFDALHYHFQICLSIFFSFFKARLHSVAQAEQESSGPPASASHTLGQLLPSSSCDRQSQTTSLEHFLSANRNTITRTLLPLPCGSGKQAQATPLFHNLGHLSTLLPPAGSYCLTFLAYLLH